MGWHVAQENCPVPDRLVSENSALPLSIRPWSAWLWADVAAGRATNATITSSRFMIVSPVCENYVPGSPLDHKSRSGYLLLQITYLHVQIYGTGRKGMQFGYFTL